MSHPLNSDGSCKLYNKILSLDKNGNILRQRPTTWMLTNGMLGVTLLRSARVADPTVIIVLCVPGVF